MKYFGTDGIRGIPNVTLKYDLIYRLANSLSYFNRDEVYIATDTRNSKDMIVSIICGVLLAKGINVTNMGVMPTPGLIYYSKIYKALAIMVTASHNPYTNNGIKIIIDGRKISAEEEEFIENKMNEIDNKFCEKIGSYYYLNNSLNEYYNLLNKNAIKTNYKIALDTANGATYVSAPNVFKNVTNDLVLIANKPNGYNINENCGSLHLNLLMDAIINNKCDFGFAFDGDGDRIMSVDKHGNIINGDLIIYILALYFKKKGLLNKDTVVLTKTVNLGIVEALSKRGISVIYSDVGDKNISDLLKKYNLDLGGETSGHIIVPKILPTGDGTLIALLLTRILTEENKEFKDYLKDIEIIPEFKIDVAVKNKKLIKTKLFAEYISKYQKEVKMDIRASGTEEVIRISLMDKNESLLENIKEDLIKLIKKIDDNYLEYEVNENNC